MATKRIKFTDQTSPDPLAEKRTIPKHAGCHFQSVPEDAVSSCTESSVQGEVRPDVMTHFKASPERNRRLDELLAAS